MKKRLKINGLLIFSVTCFVLAFPSVFFRQDSTGIGNGIFEVIGFAFVLFGLLLRVSARGYKAEKSKQGYALVNGGPYSLVRNPMYLGIAIIGLGVVLILFEWWAGAVFLLFFIGRYILLIFKEERHLILQFGQEYKTYMKQTPRLLPRLKSITKQDLKEVLPLKLSWVKKEIGSVVFVIVAVLIFESWEDIKSGGVGFYSKETAFFILIITLFLFFVNYLRSDKQTQA